MKKDKVIQLNITDELGTHVLQSKDFVVKCEKCGKERDLYKDDIENGLIVLEACECGGFNRLQYWLNGIYTEEEYNELVKKSEK